MKEMNDICLFWRKIMDKSVEEISWIISLVVNYS